MQRRGAVRRARLYKYSKRPPPAVGRGTFSTSLVEPDKPQSYATHLANPFLNLSSIYVLLEKI